MRAIVAVDKFRGFATATAAAHAIATGMSECGVDATPLPVGDGGENTADAIWRVTGGEWIPVEGLDAWDRPVTARLLRLPLGDIVLEAAHVIGLRDRPDGHSPARCSSAALGALIRSAAPYVRRRLVVCLGGTATLYGGRGLAGVLGGRIPVERVVVAADVDVTYHDCVRVFGRQKGATPAEIADLSAALTSTAAELSAGAGVDLCRLPFCGGVAGALACLGAELCGGFAVYCALTGFVDAVREADVLIAGEGRADATTWLGKAAGEVIRFARASGSGPGLWRAPSLQTRGARSWTRAPR